MPRRKIQRPEYTNQQIKEIIMAWIHDKDVRKMLCLRLIDNDGIGEIAEKMGLDNKTVGKKLLQGEAEVFKHFPG